MPGRQPNTPSLRAQRCRSSRRFFGSPGGSTLRLAAGIIAIATACAGESNPVTPLPDGSTGDTRAFVDLAPGGCRGPGGQAIPDGEAQYFFEFASHQDCGAHRELRRCADGVLGGTFGEPSCVAANADCLGPDGRPIANGSAWAYFKVAHHDDCESQKEARTCSAGVLSGSAAEPGCAPAGSCGGPDGATVSEGKTRAYYRSSEHPDCEGEREERRCQGGVLSGSYRYGVCRLPGYCVGPDGVHIANGSQRTYYKFPYHHECYNQREQRTCTFGDLSGSFGFAMCIPISGGDCAGPDGAVVKSGATKTYYRHPESNQCAAEAEVRTCSAGVLSGSNANPHCVAPGDTDECLEHTDSCSPFASCTNTTAAPVCSCEQGYSGSGTSCAPTAPMPLTVRYPNNNLPDFITIRPGWSIDFQGQAADCTGCTYAWDFRNGHTSNLQHPAAVRYDTAGYYLVTMSVSRNGTLIGTGRAAVVVWEGEFRDDFNRPSLDPETHGWIPAIAAGITWEIKDNWAFIPRIQVQAPGSTGLVAAPLVHNVRVEATLRRSDWVGDYHYVDILLRVHPTRWNGAFYRVRILQGPSEVRGGVLQIAIFRIVNPADEHGVLLNDREQLLDQGPCTGEDVCFSLYDVACRDFFCRPIHVRDVPELQNWNPERNQDVRIIVELRDVDGKPQFKVQLADPQNPADIWLEDLAYDHLPEAHRHAGLTGITTFMGDAYFDDVVVRELR